MNRDAFGLAWSADIVLAPIAGVWFIVFSIWMSTFDKFSFNGEPVTYADSPAKFISIVLGGVAAGLALCTYGALRYWFTRTSELKPTRAPS